MSMSVYCACPVRAHSLRARDSGVHAHSQCDGSPVRMDTRQILRLLILLSGLNGACEGEHEVFVRSSSVLLTSVGRFGSFNLF